MLTISNEFGDPRYPQLRQIMQAARKQVTELTASDLGLDASEVGAAGSRVQMHALFQPTSDVEVEIIEGDTPKRRHPASSTPSAKPKSSNQRRHPRAGGSLVPYP